MNKIFIRDLEIVLDFVERWNKQDKELVVARAAEHLTQFLAEEEAG